VAATALERGSTVATFNKSHFASVPEFRVKNTHYSSPQNGRP
jgi:predicted nucleic acid-binding protein